MSWYERPPDWKQRKSERANELKERKTVVLNHAEA